jgi:hypothetical protein
VVGGNTRYKVMYGPYAIGPASPQARAARNAVGLTVGITNFRSSLKSSRPGESAEQQVYRRL